MKHLVLVAALALAALPACSASSGEETAAVSTQGADGQIPLRRGTVIVDGCVLDTWSRAVLAQPTTKRLVSEVIMLCLVPRESGEVGPRDPSAKTAITALVADLHRDGYTVNLGAAFTDESGQRYDGAQTRAWLSRADFRLRVQQTLLEASTLADGIEIDLQKLPNDARSDVTALVRGVSSAVRPAKKLGVFVPPSVTEPSDLPGGDAFDRRALAPVVDRVRVMTLDYSETTAGPTIDPGWAVDAARLARSDAPNVDISFPLYGMDFGPRGTRPTTWFEAVAIASASGVGISRGATGAPFVAYRRDGENHELWFDDASSTARALGGWTYEVLPADVGVVFYGLGAEEPGLFDKLSARLP